MRIKFDSKLGDCTLKNFISLFALFALFQAHGMNHTRNHNGGVTFSKINPAKFTRMVLNGLKSKSDLTIFPHFHLIDVNLRDEQNRTLLHWASALGNIECAKIVVDKGADLEPIDAEGNTPLSLARKFNQYALVEYLLSTIRAQGRVPRECQAAATMFFDALVNRNETTDIPWDLVDVAMRDTLGRAALHWASFYGRTDYVGQLIQQGAELDTLDQFGSTPLHLAIQQRHYALAKLLTNSLRAQGHVPHGYDHVQATLNNRLIAVCNSESQESLVSLIEAGAEINTTNANGSSRAIHLAIARQNDAAVRVLVEQGADLLVRTEEGYSALHVAILTGRKDLCMYLIQQGALAAFESLDDKDRHYLWKLYNLIELDEDLYLYDFDKVDFRYIQLFAESKRTA